MNSDTADEQAPSNQNGGVGELSRAPPVVCSFCERPIEQERVDRWRGEPMHSECAVELRCGVSIRGPDG